MGIRITSVIGNRPQFIKAAAVSRRIRAHHDEKLVHTGQHYDDDMSKVFFDELGVPAPDVELGIGSGTNTEQTARMLSALEPVLADSRPDLVLVYGDTNSTLAGALAAAQSQVRLAHVEAGMRSFDRAMPEELNRVLTDHASDVLFCSTATAVANLQRESVAGAIHLVGDVMADVTLSLKPAIAKSNDLLDGLHTAPGDYFLVTAHRAGNVDDPIRLERLVALIERLPGQTVFPLHPRTAKRLDEAGLRNRLDESAQVLPPLGYMDFMQLLHNARAVLTDSGGVQKEAYLLETPCITLRDTTEWVETVDAGWNVLVDLDVEAALNAVERPLPTGGRPELYGGGNAGMRIRDVLDSYTPQP